MASFKVATYSVQLVNFRLPYAYIMLFDADKKWRARLNFYPMPQENTLTDISQTGDFIEVAFNLLFLDKMVDLLRNEKPITFNWHVANKICILSTEKEPVGEGELHFYPGPVPTPTPVPIPIP